MVAGFALRCTDATKESWIHRDCGAHARARHRREHRHFQPDQYGDVSHAAGTKSAGTGAAEIANEKFWAWSSRVLHESVVGRFARPARRFQRSVRMGRIGI